MPVPPLSLQQYYYIGDYMVNGKAKGIEAGLRDAADVTFASGAYVFPMDQVAGNVIAMLCEPDVTDSNGYDGTLYQYKQIDYDKSTARTSPCTATPATTRAPRS